MMVSGKMRKTKKNLWKIRILEIRRNLECAVEGESESTAEVHWSENEEGPKQLATTNKLSSARES